MKLLLILLFLLIISCGTQKTVKVDKSLKRSWNTVRRNIPKNILPQNINEIKTADLTIFRGFWLENPGIIEIDTSLCNTKNKKLIVLSHEIGHVLGYSHIKGDPIMGTNINHPKLHNRKSIKREIRIFFNNH